MLVGIELTGFRNYRRLDLALARPVSVFVGANGQGKTNLLEAVFFLGFLRSFRTSSLRDLCADGASTFRLGGKLRSEAAGWTRQLQAEYGERRRLQIDDRIVPTSGEFIGQFRVVAFTPDDLRLVNGPAPLRRRFLDMVLAAADPLCFQALRQYAAALKSRNAALRSAQAATNQAAAAFESILAENGAIIVAARRRLAAALESGMAERLGNILGRPVQFQLRYQCQARTDDATAFRERLAASRERDRESGYTGCGPHLDDLAFVLDGHDLRHHGSSGQCRLAALCLKMAVMHWYAAAPDAGGRDLIALVDDVTGELDAPTRAAFLAELRCANQVLATFTELPAAGTDPFAAGAVYRVANGEVTAACPTGGAG